LPVALAVTAGIVADRYGSIPLGVSLAAAIAALAAWALTRRSKHVGLPLVYLAVAAGALGAGYDQWHRDWYPPDDIGNFTAVEPRPTRLRGVLVEEPIINWQLPQSPLQSIRRVDPTQAVVEVKQLRQQEGWCAVSGRAKLIVGGHLQRLHLGDELEVVGRLSAPHGPANPGESDYASVLRDQRIRAVVQVQKTPDGVRRLAEGWPRSVTGWLAVARGWGQRALQESVPAEQAGVASALLLGEGSTMTNEDWEKYIKTGVIHVLAISGQHLVVMAWFLWMVLRLLGVRRRKGALAVALFLLAYSLLTGGRPPVIRAVVTVCAYCGGILLLRPTMPANTYALAWLTVAALNPADLGNTGCQLSFLAVAVLYWGIGGWLRRPTDPLDVLIEQSRPPWQRRLRWLGRKVALAYAITAIVWLAAAPLVAARYHLVSPVGILIGPPALFLAMVALITGFLVLVATLIWWPLAVLPAALMGLCLTGCEFLVGLGQRWRFAYRYVGDVPDWWLWGFYLGLFAFLLVEPLRRHARRFALAGLAWLCLGLAAGLARPLPDGLRCTFLAVGHGGCTVLETADGRVLLYDAGALGGPDVARRQIAPFLWHQGVRRLDEVFLSHADLDHFNGLPGLLERFAVGRVTCTPTFADKTTEGVRVVLDTMHRYGVPTRIVRAGDRLTAGDLVFDVLHPPPVGPEGNENARSLVLLVRHAGHTLLLTGDLEGPGLARVLSLPPCPVDVLMAPHHGSRIANTTSLAAWARPQVVISCQGPPRNPTRPDPYSQAGARFLGTWPEGAVTVHSAPGKLTVETFQTNQRVALGRIP
jgi:competence protein ComEC